MTRVLCALCTSTSFFSYLLHNLWYRLRMRNFKMAQTAKVCNKLHDNRTKSNNKREKAEKFSLGFVRLSFIQKKAKRKIEKSMLKIYSKHQQSPNYNMAHCHIYSGCRLHHWISGTFKLQLFPRSHTISFVSHPAVYDVQQQKKNETKHLYERRALRSRCVGKARVFETWCFSFPHILTHIYIIFFIRLSRDSMLIIYVYILFNLVVSVHRFFFFFSFSFIFACLSRNDDGTKLETYAPFEKLWMCVGLRNTHWEFNNKPNENECKRYFSIKFAVVAASSFIFLFLSRLMHVVHRQDGRAKGPKHDYRTNAVATF